MKPIIKVENLSKQYRLGTIGTGTLSNDLKRWWHRTFGKEDPFLKIGESNDRTTKGKSEYVWALKDINFEVMPGEILGIIGKNGAGKSTLLKILSKVTGPTTGSISYDGRIGSLLEVGTGFHPELTGRENIFLNGAILGMTKHEIRSKLDEIIDFSGCERYIDTPVKRYSSGMTVRLGFAVAAHLEPEILVVDEVLAVGDAEFQKKAIGKMQDVSKKEGRTVLFVSHNIANIRNLCQKGILLMNGSIYSYGEIEDVVDIYLKNSKQYQDINEVSITDSYRRYSTNKKIEFLKIKRLNNQQISINEPICVEILLKNNSKEKQARLIGMINFEDETRVGLFFSEEIEIPHNKQEFTVRAVLSNHNLAYGKYYLDFNIGLGNYSTVLTDFDIVYNTINFEVIYGKINNIKYISNWKSNWGRHCYQDIEINIIENEKVPIK